jgi:WD40 repeat protein
LISGGYDSTIQLWSLASRQEIACLTNHTHRVQSLALSADGKTLASAGWDKTIRIWDLDTRLQVALLTNHTRWVSSLAFSPDQKTLASGSADFLIKLWDTARWQETNTLRGSLDELGAIAFSPDGRTLVSGAKTGVIKTWNPLPKVRSPDVLKQPGDASVWRLRDGTLFCYHTNQVISYWDPSTLRQTAQYDAPEEIRYGRGRVFHTTLGHNEESMLDVGFVVTLNRGTEWAATGWVTQKVPENFPTADQVSAWSAPSPK